MRTAVLIALLLTWLVIRPGWASATVTPPASPEAAPVTECIDRSCGMLAAYAAARYEGRVVDPFQLASGRFVTCDASSSLADIQAMTEYLGLASRYRTDMMAAMVRRTDVPIILELRQTVVSSSANKHYATFLPTPNGLQVLHRGKHIENSATIQHLLSQMTGHGFFISVDPGAIERQEKSGQWQAWIGLVFLAGMGVGGVMLAERSFGRTCRRIGLQHAGTAFGLVVGASLCAVAWTTADGVGLHGGGVSDAVLLAAAADRTVIEIDLPEATDLLATGATFVDARLPYDYQVGHIRKAINIPVTASSEQRLNALSELDKRKAIVVYCSNSRCPYAELVANALLIDGFEEVYVYPAGYEGWIASRQGE